MKPSDLSAAARESLGEVVKLKRSGIPWDHIDEVENGLRGLGKIQKALQKALSNPKLCEADREWANALLSEISKQLNKVKKVYPPK